MLRYSNICAVTLYVAAEIFMRRLNWILLGITVVRDHQANNIWQLKHECVFVSFFKILIISLVVFSKEKLQVNLCGYKMC